MEKDAVNDVILGKQAVRSRYLNYRNSLTLTERKEKSRRIWERLKALEVYQKAKVILVYMDYRSEVMTTGLVEELLALKEGGMDGIVPKKIYAPRVEGFDIFFYEIRSLEDLTEGYQGIREPEADVQRLFTEETAKEPECLVLVPGAVFDRSGGRMGYGKGFYDRFLAKYSKLHTAALAFECQIAKRVPTEAHDRRPDRIVTELEVITSGLEEENKECRN